MKKIIVIAILILSIIVGAIAATGAKAKSVDCIRIHIRANSNSPQDREAKYLVKDKLVELLSPILIKCEDKNEAYEAVRKNLKQINIVADNALRQNGYSYTARVTLREEEFPTREYLNYTLKEGVYDSLTVELGRGEGDNWWCVAFPPLCFADDVTDYYYKSRLQELIEKCFG